MDDDGKEFGTLKGVCERLASQTPLNAPNSLIKECQNRGIRPLEKPWGSNHVDSARRLESLRGPLNLRGEPALGAFEARSREMARCLNTLDDPAVDDEVRCKSGTNLNTRPPYPKTSERASLSGLSRVASTG